MATPKESTREIRVTESTSSPAGIKDQGLTSGQAHEYLESLRSLSEQEHAHYEQVLDAYDWSADDDAFFARAVLEQGLRWTQHEIDWANWVIDGLNRRSRKSS